MDKNPNISKQVYGEGYTKKVVKNIIGDKKLEIPAKGSLNSR